VYSKLLYFNNSRLNFKAVLILTCITNRLYLSAIRSPIGSPIIVTIWKVVFANNSRTLRGVHPSSAPGSNLPPSRPIPANIGFEFNCQYAHTNDNFFDQLLASVCVYSVRQKDPSTKLQYLQNGVIFFVRNFHRLLGRKFDIDDTSFVQYYASLRKFSHTVL